MRSFFGFRVSDVDVVALQGDAVLLNPSEEGQKPYIMIIKVNAKSSAWYLVVLELFSC